MIALLLGGGWRYVIGAGLVIGGYAWLTTAAYQRGVQHERAGWDARARVAAAATLATAVQRQSHAAAAATAHAARATDYARREAPITQEVIHYVATPSAAVDCPDLRGVRIGAAAIAAANVATAAPR